MAVNCRRLFRIWQLTELKRLRQCCMWAAAGVLTRLNTTQCSPYIRHCSIQQCLRPRTSQMNVIFKSLSTWVTPRSRKTLYSRKSCRYVSTQLGLPFLQQSATTKGLLLLKMHIIGHSSRLDDLYNGKPSTFIVTKLESSTDSARVVRPEWFSYVRVCGFSTLSDVLYI